MVSIIVAFSTKGFYIGNDGKIPWSIPNDLARFAAITKDSVVVMGRKTYESIPERKRPLNNRVNIVVTTDPMKYSQTNKHENLVYVTMEDLDDLLSNNYQEKAIFIIGGESLYKRYLGIATTIYATTVDISLDVCDTKFPTEQLGCYEIDSYSPLYEMDSLKYRYITYTLSKKVHNERVYINHLKNIIENGDEREDRTGTGTRSVFGGQLKFDISKSVPMLTTKFVPFQLTLKELLFFLKGQTDSKILEAQGVNIWRSNTSKEFLEKRGLDYVVGDMGPMYGFTLRNYGKEYKGCDYDYSKDQGGYDQLKELIKGLKDDPWSRRHLITTYYIPYLEQSVLYPCHGLQTQFQYIEKDGNKYLSCHVYIRSSDGFLGLPINILSYAILTYIIAKKCGYLPYELIISFGDAHIYKNHLAAVDEQLSKNVLPFPVLEISDDVTNKKFEEIELSDFNLVGYLSHPSIKAPMAI
jgi:dihydrofolate reductase/thymidylate synthase